MKIRVTVSTGMVGSKRQSEIEIDDDADAETIEEAAREEMFNLIEWGWEPVSK